MRLFCVLLCSLLWCSSLLGQDAPKARKEYPTVNSDRPGFSYSANVLKPGKMVLQSGFIFKTNQALYTEIAQGSVTANRSSWSHDDLLRIGIIDRLEIGIGAAYLRESTRDIVYHVNGPIIQPQASPYKKRSEFMTLPTFMIRAQVWEETEKLPALNVQYQVDVTFNMDNTPEVEPNIRRSNTNNLFRISLAKSLNEHVSIASNINVPTNGNKADYTLNLGYSFFNGGVFAEAFGSFDNGFTKLGNTAPIVNLNGGVWLRVNNSVRLDLGAGRFAGANDHYFGAVGATFSLN